MFSVVLFVLFGFFCFVWAFFKQKVGILPQILGAVYFHIVILEE